MPRTGPTSLLGGLFGGVQEDVQEAAFVVGVVVREVSFDVFDGLGQDEEPIS